MIRCPHCTDPHPTRQQGKARICKKGGLWWAWYVPKAKGQHTGPLAVRDTEAALRAELAARGYEVTE